MLTGNAGRSGPPTGGEIVVEDQGLDEELVFSNRLLAGLVRQEAVPQSFCGLQPIPRNPATEVPDGPFNSFVLDDRGRRCAVLMVSNSAFPDAVLSQLSNSQRMWGAMGAELGKPILRPRAHGFEEGRSFAIWPLRRPPSRNRLLLALEKRLVAGPVLSWLKGVAVKTRIELPRSQIEQKYQAPLLGLVRGEDLDPAVRQLARKALAALEAGQWTPQGVLSHNDLWIGNVLFDGGPLRTLVSPSRFTVIDWGGGYRHGYPTYDSFYFGRSIGLNPWLLRRALVSYCSRLAMPLDHVAYYVCAAAGVQGTKRDCFPRQRFVELCGGTAQSLRQLGLA